MDKQGKDLNAGVIIENKIQFRKIAIALEVVALIAIMIGLLVSDPQTKSLALLIAAAIYLFGSWYLFKAEKFKPLNVVISLIFGFIIFYTILSWL